MENKKTLNYYIWLALETITIGGLIPLLINCLVVGAYTAAIVVLYLAVTLMVSVTLKKIRSFQESVHTTFVKLLLEFLVATFGLVVTAFVASSYILAVTSLVGFFVILIITMVIIAHKMLH